MAQVISFIQEKGGAGKTTLLCSIAALLVADGAKVAVVDTDDRRNLENWAKKGQIDLDWTYEDDDERLIPLVKSLKASIDPVYDAVLIDTAGFKSAISIYAINAADLVLIPCKADESNAKCARRTFSHVQNVAMSMDKEIPARVVMTDIDPHTNITKAIVDAIDAADVPRLSTMCGHRTGFKEMQSTGQGPQGAARAAAGQVMAELQSLDLLTYYTEAGQWAKSA